MPSSSSPLSSSGAGVGEDGRTLDEKYISVMKLLQYGESSRPSLPFLVMNIIEYLYQLIINIINIYFQMPVVSCIVNTYQQTPTRWLWRSRILSNLPFPTTTKPMSGQRAKWTTLWGQGGSPKRPLRCQRRCHSRPIVVSLSDATRTGWMSWRLLDIN